MTTGPMRRLPLSYVADVMPFSWSWCQYSLLVTRCQRTLNRKLSLCLCSMLSVISQLKQRIFLLSLTMLSTPPLWFVHFFSSSCCAQGNNITEERIFFRYSTQTFLCLFICLILNFPISEEVHTKLSFLFFTNSAKLTKLVKEHLGVFLQGAQNLKPEPSHVKEVCFLCVQCMEVRKRI